MCRIEKANLEDLDEILRLQYLAYQSEAALFGSNDIPPLKQKLDEVTEEYAQGRILKMIDEDGTIIGSVRAKEADGTVYIGKLMVHPDHRRKGYGRRLLTEIEQSFAGKRYELFTSTRSKDNIRLYQDNGYREFDQRIVKDDLIFVYMEKMKSEVSIRKLSAEERSTALDLAWRVFSEYESPDYGEEGIEEFRKCLHDEGYLAGIEYYGAFDGERLIGLVGIRSDKKHICFFFVDGKYHRQGIGTKLFKAVRQEYPNQIITLNSSPYGVPFYHALGFTDTDKEQTVNGIWFTPMKYEDFAEDGD
ncbi:GNAT family N-acetyltransferase [Oribacterium sp. C9]|uniref:GNAT family N-acetyltransferase n=1 Tax=Oribacterium sp. C9 TaxID=1943579 RepID=UPI001FA8B954|nr:GNAT family N-acetyltransferase [Oribacterium sp. C9]